MKNYRFITVGAFMGVLAFTTTSRAQYAIFDTPINGFVPTQSYYELNPDKNVKKLIEIEEDESFTNQVIYYFDEDQRLVRIDDSAYSSCYAPVRWQFAYGEDGRLSNVEKTFEVDLCDSGITPLVKLNYDYKWKDGLVDEIAETINVDGGLNYSGSPTHLKIRYNSESIPVEAVCEENPKVKIRFDENGKVESKSAYGCYYSSDKWGEYDGEMLDELFERGVNLTIKMPLAWDFEEDKFHPVNWESVFEIEIPDGEVKTKDTFGNWTKKISSQFSDYDDEEIEVTTTREIEYY